MIQNIVPPIYAIFLTPRRGELEGEGMEIQDDDDADFRGRRVSGASSDSDSAKDVVLDGFSVRAIGLYQKQAELTDRLWSYFGSLSFFAILLALTAPVFRMRGWLPHKSGYFVVLICLVLVAYFAFSVGNRSSLRQSQEALERIAAQAQMASGIKLRVIRPKDAAFFHGLVTLITLAIMIVGFKIALTGETAAREGSNESPGISAPDSSGSPARSRSQEPLREPSAPSLPQEESNRS
jgi:hypothetical protein